VKLQVLYRYLHGNIHKNKKDSDSPGSYFTVKVFPFDENLYGLFS
jgi:hypothetical protein